MHAVFHNHFSNITPPPLKHWQNKMADDQNLEQNTARIVEGEPNASGGGGGGGNDGSAPPLSSAPFLVPRHPGSTLVLAAMLAPDVFVKEVKAMEKRHAGLIDHEPLKALKAAVAKHPYLGKAGELQGLAAAFCPRATGRDKAVHHNTYAEVVCIALGQDRFAYPMSLFSRVPEELRDLTCEALRFCCAAPPQYIPEGKWPSYVLDITSGELYWGGSSQVNQPKVLPWTPGSHSFRPFLKFRVSVKLLPGGKRNEIAGGTIEMLHFFPPDGSSTPPTLQSIKQQYDTLLEEVAAATSTNWQDPSLYPTLLRGAQRSAACEIFEELQGHVRVASLRFSPPPPGAAGPLAGNQVEIELLAREEDVSVVGSAMPQRSPRDSLADTLRKRFWEERSLYEYGTVSAVTGRIVLRRKAQNVTIEPAPHGGFPDPHMPQLVISGAKGASGGGGGGGGGGAAGGAGVEGEPQQPGLAPLVAGMGDLALAPAHAALPLAEAQAPPLHEETLCCRDCSLSFPFTAQEQRRFKELCYPAPVRCPACREKKKQQQGGSGRGAFRGSGGGGGGWGRW